DIDNDGDIDIVVTDANGPIRLLLNQMGSRNHWLEALVRGVKSNRDAYGARVVLYRKGGPPTWRRVATDGSYLSAHDPRVHFGLGTDTDVKDAPPQQIVVVWPDGHREKWEVAKFDCVVQLIEGTGTA